MINLEEIIGQTFYRPVPKIDHKNETKKFITEEVMLTKKCNTFYWGNEECHPSWLIENALLFFKTKEECEDKCNQLNYEKGYVKVDENNIHLYYKFMSEQDIIKQGGFLLNIIRERTKELVRHFDNQVLHYGVKSIDSKELTLDLPRSAVYRLKIEVHGIIDTLKPIEEYISEIKESEDYKSYIAKVS